MTLRPEEAEILRRLKMALASSLLSGRSDEVMVLLPS